jgi:hypothetical protein
MNFNGDLTKNYSVQILVNIGNILKKYRPFNEISPEKNVKIYLYIFFFANKTCEKRSFAVFDFFSIPQTPLTQPRLITYEFFLTKIFF